jgi:hypothetical protein
MWAWAKQLVTSHAAKAFDGAFVHLALHMHAGLAILGLSLSSAAVPSYNIFDHVS